MFTWNWPALAWQIKDAKHKIIAFAPSDAKCVGTVVLRKLFCKKSSHVQRFWLVWNRLRCGLDFKFGFFFFFITVGKYYIGSIVINNVVKWFRCHNNSNWWMLWQYSYVSLYPAGNAIKNHFMTDMNRNNSRSNFIDAISMYVAHKYSGNLFIKLAPTICVLIRMLWLKCIFNWWQITN